MRTAKDLEQIRQCCDDLAAEPMWTLSLGSKELFHSNLLGWLCDTLPAPAVARLLGIAPATPPAAAAERWVAREFHKFDLTIRLPGHRPAVVENKVFSLPDLAQLDRYTPEVVRALPDDPDLILLSLKDPGWADGKYQTAGRTWRYVSWRDIADRLDTLAASDDIDDPFVRSIVAHEAVLLRLLDRALTAAAVTTDPQETVALEPGLAALLDDTRLRAAVEKFRASQILPMIEDLYDTAGLTPTLTEIEYTNGQPLLAAYWTDPDGGLSVGWQMQHGQWRLAMIMNKDGLVGNDNAKARSAYAAKHPAWFDFAPLHHVLDVTEDQVRVKGRRPDANGFNKYNPNFVYTYQRLPATTTVGQLLRLAVAYGRLAQRWTFPDGT